MFSSIWDRSDISRCEKKLQELSNPEIHHFDRLCPLYNVFTKLGIRQASQVHLIKKNTIFVKTRLASPRAFLNVPKRSQGQYYVEIDSFRPADDHPTPPDDRDRASRTPTDRPN